MKSATLDKAVALSRELEHVLIATSDVRGTPHLAAAQSLAREPDDVVSVVSWYCPGTIRNLTENPQVAIVAWDRSRDIGYQLIGRVENVRDLAIMNGFALEIEGQSPLPEIEKQLFVRVERIVSFHAAAHADVEE